MRNSNFRTRFGMMLAELGYTQKDFSKVSGLTEAAICRYLDGSRVPNTNTLVIISDVTNVSPNWLLGYGADDNMVKI